MSAAANHPANAPRVFGLDLLRALAIALVMVAHSYPNALHGTRLGDHLDGLGPPGVEIFFALSGFLIGGILLRDLADPARAGLPDILRFWKRRWYRTLPNYYLFLLVHAALALGRRDSSLTVAAFLPHLVFAQNLLSAPPWFFFGSWTLALEEWSYLVLPPLLWAGRRLGLPGPRAALAGMAAIVGATIAFRAASHAGLPWTLDVQKAVLRRLDALLLGVAAAWIARYRPAVWSRLRPLAWPGAAGLVALAALGVAWGDFDAAPAWARVLYPTALGICCASLLPWASGLAAADGWFARAVRHVSLVSYSLYLCHVPVRLVLYQVLHVRLRLPDTWMGEVVFQAACWAAYLGCATLVYRWFEKPAMDLRDRAPRAA